MAGSDARELAAVLANLDDETLERLLVERGVPASAPWNDAYDAAESLLEPALITRSLAALTADEAAAIERASLAGTPTAPAHRSSLHAHGVIREDGVVLDVVRGIVDALPRVVVGPRDTAPGESADAAAERALVSSASLADLLLVAVHHPLGRIGSGALGAADRRRLIEEGAVTDAQQADELIAIAETVGVLAGAERNWTITAEGARWLRTSTIDRWVSIARGLREELPSALRTSNGGWTDPSTWAGAYPFDIAWPERAVRLRALFVRWAIFAADGAAFPWTQDFADGGAPNVAALETLLPHEVDRIYLQNDLTAIAPGPLAPVIDVRLRSIARRETRAQASSYRFSADTLGRALSTGETADTIRAFLSEISLTGLPQPLDYEIGRAAERHGRIRVGADEHGTTVIRSADDTLLESLLVDHALRPLGLVRDDDHLSTRSGASTTYWMLLDARYPVVAVDDNGSPRAVARAGGAGTSAAVAADYAPLIARLRANKDDDSEGVWLHRELEQAVRERAVLDAVVRLPDGSERTFTLEATGLGGGRLRGRDRAADVERTLPISSIVRATRSSDAPS